MYFLVQALAIYVCAYETVAAIVKTSTVGMHHFIDLKPEKNPAISEVRLKS